MTTSINPSLSAEETQEIESLAFGYGFPYARLLIIKELVYKRNNLSPSENHPENRAVLDNVIEQLRDLVATSKYGPRPFKASVGDVYLGTFTRGDPILYGANIQTPIDHIPVDESEEVTLHRTILEEVAKELFMYVNIYISIFMERMDNSVYRVACDLLGCDRLVTVTEELTVPLRVPEGNELGEGSEQPTTIKKCLCLGMMRDTDEVPNAGRYFLAPTLV